MAATTIMSAADKPSTVAVFDAFRAEIDDYNDVRERLIKASRDITNISKKAIFLLHRVAQGTLAADEDPAALSTDAAQQGFVALRAVQALYATLAPELAGDRFWRFHRQVSPGLQEYIEALSFAHYLAHGTLISLDAVQATLAADDGTPYFPLPVADYLLGLADLTGELMRFAISGIARRGGRARAQDVCAFVRACKAEFERWTPHIRELKKKQVVTSQSLEKIEDAAYAIVVRTSEYDLAPEMLDAIVAQSLSSYGAGPSAGGGGGARRRGGRDDASDDDED